MGAQLQLWRRLCYSFVVMLVMMTLAGRQVWTAQASVRETERRVVLKPVPGEDGGRPGVNLQTGAIDLEKLVSVDGGATYHDADNAPGPQAETGEEVRFRFVVTNNGSVPLSNIVLVDSDFEVSGCTIPTTLEAGGSFECTIGPFAAVEGQHSNTAAVMAQAGDSTVSDIDTAHYFSGDIDDDDPPIIIIIEGPIDVIIGPIIIIFGFQIVLDPDDPILIDLEVGDIIHLEGELIEGDDGSITIIVITIIIVNIDIDIIVPPPGGGGDDDDGMGMGMGMGMGDDDDDD